MGMSETFKMPALQYQRSYGLTLDEMRRNLDPDFVAQGDAILVWVNEGTFWGQALEVFPRVVPTSHPAPAQPQGRATGEDGVRRAILNALRLIADRPTIGDANFLIERLGKLGFAITPIAAPPAPFDEAVERADFERHYEEAALFERDGNGRYSHDIQQLWLGW